MNKHFQTLAHFLVSQPRVFKFQAATDSSSPRSSIKPLMRTPLDLCRRHACRRLHRLFATVADERRIPQTVIEKVVQKYAVGLPQGRIVKAGDYVMIRPEHVMTHDNTGPVISKCDDFYLIVLLKSNSHLLDLTPSAQHGYITQHNQFLQ